MSDLVVGALCLLGVVKLLDFIIGGWVRVALYRRHRAEVAAGVEWLRRTAETLRKD